MKIKLLLPYIAVSLLWGSSWIANQQIGDQVTPLALGALRFAIAAVIVMPFARMPSQAAIGHAGVLGVTMLSLPYALLVWSGVHGAGNWTPLAYAALPLFVAAAGWRPAMIVAVGATLVLLSGALPWSPRKALWAAPILAAVASQGFALLYARRHPPGRTELPIQFLAAAVLVASLSRAFERAPRVGPWSGWSPADLVALAALSTLGTALAYWLYYRLLVRLEPSQAASTQWLQLVFTVGESALIFGRRPPLAMLGSIAILIACCVRLLYAPLEDDVTIRLTPPG